MNRPKSLFPSYCHHKAKGLAYVTLGGRVHYLGKYGSEESRREYDRLIAIWVAQGRPDDFRDRAPTLLKEVVLAYWDCSQGYYVKKGKVTAETACIKTALRPLVKLFGDTPADEFTAQRLRVVRESMVEMGWKAVAQQGDGTVVLRRWLVTGFGSSGNWLGDVLAVSGSGF